MNNLKYDVRSQLGDILFHEWNEIMKKTIE
jgi:hypothetical protein